MKIEVEGGIDFIIKRRKNEIATDFDLQSDRANKTVHKTISFCLFFYSLSLFINRKLCNAIIFLMALKSICIESAKTFCNKRKKNISTIAVIRLFCCFVLQSLQMMYCCISVAKCNQFFVPQSNTLYDIN